MSDDDEQAKDAHADDDADTAASPPADEDPNKSTKGLLDEEKLREDAAEVDQAIKTAKNRSDSAGEFQI
jgi:hypothetical protein